MSPFPVSAPLYFIISCWLQKSTLLSLSPSHLTWTTVVTWLSITLTHTVSLALSLSCNFFLLDELTFSCYNPLDSLTPFCWYLVYSAPIYISFFIFLNKWTADTWMWSPTCGPSTAHRAMTAGSLDSSWVQKFGEETRMGTLVWGEEKSQNTVWSEQRWGRSKEKERQRSSKKKSEKKKNRIFF